MSTGTSPNVEQMLQQGRSATFDYLAADAPIEEIASLLVAMANSHGGMLLLGVGSDPGQITGVENPANTTDRVLQAALSCEPSLIIPLPQTLRVTGQQIIAVSVPSGMPHVYAIDGRYLVRMGGANTPLNPHDLRRLMIERGQLSFESEIAGGATLDDIDWDRAALYAGKLQGIRERDATNVLLKRGCLARRGEQLYPTNAGIMLFGRDPQRFVRGAEITAARFAGDSMGDTFVKQDLTGTLDDQIRRAETFLADHMRRDVSLRGSMARQEEFEYPFEAVRELVVNAVAHRDYSIAGDNIRLFIFSRHLEINSPGGLPGHMTIDNIKDERFSRNPVIVQVLSDMGFIERLGYGVDRVIELMERQHLPAPVFQERAGGFVVLLRKSETAAAEQPAPGQTGTPEMVGGMYDMVDINPRQEAALLSFHREGHKRITNSDLQQLFPDVHPETIRRDLVDLVNKGVLVKMGQKRGSYYVLRSARPDDGDE